MASLAGDSSADDASISTTYRRALPTTVGAGYHGGFLDGLSFEQGVMLSNAKLKKMGRKSGCNDTVSLDLFCRGHRPGFCAGASRRFALGPSNAFERGFIDGHSSISNDWKNDSSDADDTVLMEGARTLGFADDEAIKGYSCGFRASSHARASKKWGKVGAGSIEAAAAKAANFYGRGHQFEYVVGAVEFDGSQNGKGGCSGGVLDVENEEIGRAMGIAKQDDITCFCTGFSHGNKATMNRVEARLRAGDYDRNTLDEKSDAYSPGYEDGFAYGLSQWTGGNKYDDLEQRIKASGLSRPELEIRGLGLGYSNQKAIDNYCSGF
jgi:hypothetical protein